MAHYFDQEDDARAIRRTPFIRALTFGRLPWEAYANWLAQLYVLHESLAQAERVMTDHPMRWRSHSRPRSAFRLSLPTSTSSTARNGLATSSPAATTDCWTRHRGRPIDNDALTADSTIAHRMYLDIVQKLTARICERASR